MNPISAAGQGLIAAQTRFNASASNVASAGADISPAAIVDMLQSKTSFQAAAQVVRVTSRMTDSLLDILA